MKILHTADIHLGDLNGPVRDGKNARRQDTLQCMIEIANAATREAATGKPVNVAIIAGDLFNRSRVWADTALEDITDAINELLRPLCRVSEQVVLLFGTENHDNPRAFEVIAQTTKGEANLHIYTQPGVYTLGTSEGEVQILALPGFDKGRLRAFMPDMDKEMENRNATALINDVLLGLSTKLDKTIPSILVAHYTVAGSEAESGSTFLAGQDVVLLPQTIDATGVTLATLGHIHKPQKLNCKTPAFYCGSPNQLTFNDEQDTHGFYIHRIDGAAVTSERHATPERRHKTVRLQQDDIGFFIAEGKLPGIIPSMTDAIVRVRYTATAEQDKALNKAALQKHLLDSGAFHVAEILAEDLDDGVSAYEEVSDDTPAASLRRYLDMAGTDSADSARLEELATPLIRKADDGREADRHTGAFIPKRIEVRNYRSYTTAAFDFADIRMAMVNGQNGVGKSSLFMDAIADCLFEESRDGQIGGWLREGEKSGAVTFEFEMGGIEYRVVRTRTKSGKGTLAFNRRGESGDWEDCGDSTMKLTQAKIEQTLGMDCQTFCSIALIRQDAYGLFLEADSDRRMEVLSALLNLGVYVRLEELAKAEASEQRKRIAQTKDRMTVLADQIAAKDALESEDAALAESLGSLAADLQVVDESITAAQREEALRQEVTRQAQEKTDEAAKLTAEANRKANDLATLRAQQEEANTLANMTPSAEKATSAVTAARGMLDILAPAEADLKNINERRSALLSTASNTDNGLKAIAQARQTHQATLARKDEIEAAVKRLDELTAERAKLDERTAQFNEAVQKVHTLELARKDFIAESRTRINALTAQIDTATKKAAILRDSGCPIPDKATCNFLRDAKEAKDGLAALQESLSKTRAADRTEYERIQKDTEAAQATLAATPNPREEAANLTQEETRLKPIAALAPRLAAAAASLAELDKQEAELLTTRKETEEALREIALKAADLEKQAAKAAEQREVIRTNELTAALLAKCTAAKATVDALTARIAELQTDIDGIHLKAATAAQEAQGIRDRIPTEAPALAALTERRRTLTEAQNNAIAERGGIKTRLEAIADAQRQYDEYAAEVKATARSLNDYQTLAQAFGIDGIQYMIIRSIVPEIMHRSNDILAAMTGGRMAVDFKTEREQKSNQKIVNSLDVWITSITGGSRPYSSHSGGEKVKIALAVTLGLADVKARRAGVQLGMLFIDEPPFLDADGTEAYADALTNMAARNPGMRILAISHDPTMKARFQQNIIVTAGENGSEVTMD
ncbi:metallophosphoesterase [Desulfitobacterium sp.]|uniref:metallophosphoesterase n=1 Tax=Desulfitobacterium sp. TaxID=49981 RepID=UPI002B2075A8|nr:AAA family ATPase [Desulfitobacterium sp.]MEA4901888.1 metallophosphoesterase [Desulfitobacterium sp.]